MWITIATLLGLVCIGGGGVSLGLKKVYPKTDGAITSVNDYNMETSFPPDFIPIPVPMETAVENEEKNAETEADTKDADNEAQVNASVTKAEENAKEAWAKRAKARTVYEEAPLDSKEKNKAYRVFLKVQEAHQLALKEVEVAEADLEKLRNIPTRRFRI